MRRRRGLQIQRQSPTVKVEIDLQWLIVSMARASSDFDTSGLVLLGVSSKSIHLPCYAAGQD